jgi:hypothetical protein
VGYFGDAKHRTDGLLGVRLKQQSEIKILNPNIGRSVPAGTNSNQAPMNEVQMIKTKYFQIPGDEFRFGHR